MISYTNFTSRGRLGNWLFQYAFLRSSAQRLGVRFYCPEWIGDHIFLLNDQKERAAKPEGINKTYKEPLSNCGFNPSALDIEDGTNIRGWFQTERYFDNTAVKKWYMFKDEKMCHVKEKYRHIDFSEVVGLHLRFGDRKFHAQYVIPAESYYIKALKKIKKKKYILLFSDEPEHAKKHLKNLQGNLNFIEGNEFYEDLYLMTRCHDFVCSSSTMSWWGAWLNDHSDKTIVAPKEWLRPGYVLQNHDLLCDGWLAVQTCTSFLDNYHVVLWKKRIEKIKNRILARLTDS